MNGCKDGKEAVNEGIRRVCGLDPAVCDRIDRGEETVYDVVKIRRAAYVCLWPRSRMTVLGAHAAVDREIARRGLARGKFGPWR